MNTCDFNWWQMKWFLASIPFLFSGLGWFLKVLWEKYRPYEKDIKTFKSIENLFSSAIEENGSFKGFSFISSILNSFTHPEPDCSLDKKTYSYIIRLGIEIRLPKYTFLSKKMNRNWKCFQAEIFQFVNFLENGYRVASKEENLCNDTTYILKEKIEFFEKPREFTDFIEAYKKFIKSSKIIQQKI